MGDVTLKPMSTIFGTFCVPDEIITCAKFGFDWSRGFWLGDGPKIAFPILNAPYP
jgi:hypothetical protein